MTTIHAFEKAGLGIAPFRLVRVEMIRYKACPECPSQPGTSCDYCGEAIVETCFIRDANGHEFKVGNVCVGKTGDRGIIDPVKRELNRLRTEERHRREDEKIAEGWLCLHREDVRQALEVQPHPYLYHAEQGRTMYDFCTWMIQNGGRKGAGEGAKIAITTAKKLDQGDLVRPSDEELERAAQERAQAEEERRREAEEAERIRIETEALRLETIRKENAWMVELLTGDGGFISSMRHELSRRPIRELSSRQLDILADIYAKSKARRGSRVYQDAWHTFWELAR